MIKIFAMLVAFLLAWPPPAGCREHALEIGPQSLAQSAAQLLGKRVMVDACVYVHFHGMQIAPCGYTDWRLITPLSDPNDKVEAAFSSLGMVRYGSIRAVVEGVIINEAHDWPKPGVMPVLKVERVSHARRMSPNNSFKPKPLRGSA